MRDYTHIDRYLNSIALQVYPQPPDDGHSKLAEKVIDFWMSRMTTCHSVLDVGCGYGFCQDFFQKWNVTYEGICLGEDYIQAKSLGRTVRNMDFNFLDYPDDSFDLIFSRHSLEHSPMPVVSLMEWGRVAKNWLGIVVPAPEWYGYKGQNHYSVANMEQIKNWIEASGAWRILWENIDSLPFEPKKKESMRPHEYWFMLEKKR